MLTSKWSGLYDTLKRKAAQNGINRSTMQCTNSAVTRESRWLKQINMPLHTYDAPQTIQWLSWTKTRQWVCMLNHQRVKNDSDPVQHSSITASNIKTKHWLTSLRLNLFHSSHIVREAMAENVRRDEGHQSFISIQVTVLSHAQDQLGIVTNDQALPRIFNILMPWTGSSNCLGGNFNLCFTTCLFTVVLYYHARHAPTTYHLQVCMRWRKTRVAWQSAL
jgi:hypothetical protein